MRGGSKVIRLRWDVRYIDPITYGPAEAQVPPAITAALFEESDEGERRIVRRVTYRIEKDEKVT